MSRLNRTTAAVFLTGVWLTSPLAVGVAAADMSANDSASDSADSDGAGGSPPRASEHDAAPSVRGDVEPVFEIEAPEKNLVEIDLPLPEPLPDVGAIDEQLPGEPEVGAEEALAEAQSGEAVEEAPDGEAADDSPDETAEESPGQPVEDALPEAQPGEADEEADEEAAPDSGAEPTDPATEDAGGDGAPQPDPKGEASTADQQSGDVGDVVGGRGGGITPLPFWRGGVGGPQTDGDPEPGALESTSVDGVLPDPPDLPVYYFGGPTDPAKPLLTAGGADQPPGGDVSQSALGAGTLIEAVANGINQILDAVGAWVSGLPAGPLQDLLAGALLLVRNALPQQWVKFVGSTDGTGQLIDGDGDGDRLEGLTGLSESDAEAAAGERGLAVRVVARDGEFFAVTKDYRTDRVNFVIENGVVVKASIG